MASIAVSRALSAASRSLLAGLVAILALTLPVAQVTHTTSLSTLSGAIGHAGIAPSALTQVPDVSHLHLVTTASHTPSAPKSLSGAPENPPIVTSAQLALPRDQRAQGAPVRAGQGSNGSRAPPF